MSFLDRVKDAATPVIDEARAALENGTTLRISGAGAWLDAGRPVRADATLSLRERSRVLDYVPGDLTITVGAGTTLRALRETVAEHGQWVPIDPFGPEDGTVGATAATSSFGPLAHAFGTPRDQVIGAGVVTGRGDYVRGGGRVVKNVAGFDLTRLMIGAWGTLGAIVDVTLRLRVKPQADVTLKLGLPDDDGLVANTLAAIAEAPLAPYAIELLNPRLASLVGAGDHTVALVRVGGNLRAVAAQRTALAGIGSVEEVDAVVWERLRDAEPAESLVARYSAPLSETAALWRSITSSVNRKDALVHSTIGRGVLRCIVPSGAIRAVDELPSAPRRGARTFERLPAAMWADVASPAVDALSLRVRKAFDPGMILNPGILGELPA